MASLVMENLKEGHGLKLNMNMKIKRPLEQQIIDIDVVNLIFYLLNNTLKRFIFG